MRHLVFILFSFAFFLFASGGCKKPKSTPSGGGLGGSATIIARADHAGALLDTAIVWIKYGSPEPPANGVYDDSLIVSPNAQAVFTNLTPGSYYLFAEGIHDPYQPPTVSGGKVWIINSNTEIDTDNITTGQQYFTFPTWWHVL